MGSYQGCSQALHGRPRARASEAADGRREASEGAQRVAADGWGRGASEHEALGVFMHDVHRRWGSVLWRSWACVIRAPPARRVPVIH